MGRGPFPYFLTLSLLVTLGAIAYFIWPTPYAYEADGALRIHRLSGEIWVLTPNGWEPRKGTKAEKLRREPLTQQQIEALEARMSSSGSRLEVELYNPHSFPIELAKVRVVPEEKAFEEGLVLSAEETVIVGPNQVGYIDFHAPSWFSEGIGNFTWYIEEANRILKD